MRFTAGKQAIAAKVKFDKGVLMARLCYPLGFEQIPVHELVCTCSMDLEISLSQIFGTGPFFHHREPRETPRTQRGLGAEINSLKEKKLPSLAPLRLYV